MARFAARVSESWTIWFNIFGHSKTGAGSSTDIKEGMKCKVECSNAIATPDVINCLNTGWDAERHRFFLKALFPNFFTCSSFKCSTKQFWKNITKAPHAMQAHVASTQASRLPWLCSSCWLCAAELTVTSAGRWSKRQRTRTRRQKSKSPMRLKRFVTFFKSFFFNLKKRTNTLTETELPEWVAMDGTICKRVR